MIHSKHLVRIAYALLLCGIMGSTLLYRYLVVDKILIQQIADRDQYISTKFQSEVINVSQIDFSELFAQERSVLLRDVNFIKLIKDASVLFSTINARFSLYDKQGHKLFTNSHDIDVIDVSARKSANMFSDIVLFFDRYFLSKFFPRSPIREAAAGKIQYALVLNAQTDKKTDYRDQISYVKSYLPITNPKKGKFKIEGVIEICTDITEHWDRITSVQRYTFFTLGAIALIFLIVIIYNTTHAQNIIDGQNEINRALEAAKLRAETESSAKTTFLANVSHELRTPLNAVIGYADLIIAESYGPIPKEYAEYVTNIRDSGQHLLEVINDILSFSKALHGNLTVEAKHIDLYKVLVSCTRYVKPIADTKGIQLIEKFPTEHIIVTADPKRLKQGIINLLSNAVKFTMEGGSITIMAKQNQTKKKVDISVTDTGIGMNEWDIPKALSPFEQVDNKLSRKYAGTGLGLPLTKKLVELMGGEFRIKSAEGKGTTVTLTFSYQELTDL